MKSLNKLASIRGNLVVYSLCIIVIMALISLYTLSIMNKYKSQIDTMFEKHIFLSDIKSSLIDLDADLIGFLSSKSSARLNDYLIDSENIEDVLESFYDTGLIENNLTMKNIKNLISQYKDEADMAITFKRQRNVGEYSKHYEKCVKIQEFIMGYIQQMNDEQININSIAYKELISQSKLLIIITTVIVLDLIICSLLVVYLITKKMVRPFTILFNSAEEISKGNYETKDIKIESEDEFKILSEAFNDMKNSISNHINELEVKAHTEAALKDEQMKNLKMAYLLDNAKLSALQSQINPHFLFNTINAGVQLSVIERATRTGEFLDSLSRLFRYNLQKTNTECTLEDEINNIKDYYDLLKVRFADRIRFEFIIDEDSLDLIMPPMILQPLVENSYIHGLSSLESGGLISIVSKRKESSVELIIKDTGVGVNKDKIKKILSRGENEFGIGIRNVRDRLELFYRVSDIFEIESILGEGVKIIINIPTE